MNTRKLMAFCMVLAMVLTAIPMATNALVLDVDEDGTDLLVITAVGLENDTGFAYNDVLDVYEPGWYNLTIDFEIDDQLDTDLVILNVSIYDLMSGDEIIDENGLLLDYLPRAMDSYSLTFFDLDFSEESIYMGWVNVSGANTSVRADEAIWSNWTLIYNMAGYAGMIDEDGTFLEPLEVFPGDLVSGECLVWNDGTEDANYTLSLTVDGVEEASNWSLIDVGMNDTFVIEYDTTGMVPDTYDIVLDLYVNDTTGLVFADSFEEELVVSSPLGDITGFVVYENETGADVVVADIDVWIALNETTNASTTTNATGYYEFVDLVEGTYTVWVNSTFYYLGDEVDFVVEKGITLIDANLTIEYYALSTINGTVLDEDGAALEGVSLVLEENSDFTAETDVNGSYLIEDVPVGSYLLNATLDGYYFSVEFAEVDEDGVTVDFELSAWVASFCGYVFAELNETTTVAVANATVLIDGTELTTETNASGWYMFEDVLLDTYTVVANVSGWVDANVEVVLDEADAMVMYNNITLDEKFIPDVAFIYGWITEDGVGVNGSKVVIEWSHVIVNSTVNATNVTVWNNITEKEYFNTTSNATGYYVTLVPLPLALFSVWVDVPATYDPVTPAAVNLTGKAKLSMTLVNFTLVKKVIPPSKYALTITVVPKDAIVKVDNVLVTVNATTGVVVVPDLAIGNHTVEVSKTGFVTQTKTIAIVDKDEAVTITLVAVVPPTYTIKFQIKDKDGNGVKGYKVVFTYLGKDYSGTTNETGWVEFKDMDVAALPANVTIKATKSGWEDLKWNGDATIPVAAKEDGGSSALLWIILAIVLVVIIVVVVIIIMKGKKKEEVPSELKESGEVPEEGAEGAEGEKKEGEELAEGDTLAEDKEAVEDGPEKEGDFKADETEEETEGVEEGADEMEDFEDEPDEDLDEDVGENYEDELDEEEEEK